MNIHDLLREVQDGAKDDTIVSRSWIEGRIKKVIRDMETAPAAQPAPYIPPYCKGEKCFCGRDAVRKIECAVEYPTPVHPLTAYVCDFHFVQAFGAGAKRQFPNVVSDAEEYARCYNAWLKAHEPRPAAEYHEDMGAVLWWRLEQVGQLPPIEYRWAGEPPYVGSPNDLGIGVRLDITAMFGTGGGHKLEKGNCADFYVGGWREDYYTHFTPIIVPELPK